MNSTVRFVALSSSMVLASLGVLTAHPQASTMRKVRQVRIDYGSFGSVDWDVSTSRESSYGRADRPCLAAQLFIGEGDREERTRIRACGSLRGSSVVVSNSHGASRDERTVLAMAFGPEARSVRLWLQGRKTRLISLNRLGRIQARRTGLNRYRYAALGLSGRFCLQRFAIYDRKSSLIEMSLQYGCQGEG